MSHTILGLCAGSGAWSEPYRQAGYDVRRITLPDYDVRSSVPPARVTGVLAAPPCESFSLTKNGQERDLAAGLAVVEACLRTIWRTRPRFWALENPRGLLSRWLGPPVAEFEPWQYGDPWTKRTCLWGRFELPERSPVTPKAGISRLGSDAFRKAITPLGFAARFFQANNPADAEGDGGEVRPQCRRCGEFVGVVMLPGGGGRRRDVVYCSNACRQRAYRDRRASITCSRPLSVAGPPGKERCEHHARDDGDAVAQPDGEAEETDLRY